MKINEITKGKISKMMPGQSAEIDHGDGTKTVVDLKTNPGALQKDIEVDSFLMATHGLGFDGLAHFYKSKNIINKKMSSAFSAHSNWPNNLASPYIVEASEKLLTKFNIKSKLNSNHKFN